jgi:hypothetical protein
VDEGPEAAGFGHDDLFGLRTSRVDEDLGYTPQEIDRMEMLRSLQG